jgi:DNA-binding transcriptional regulator LsrR (DeoR family)
LFDRKETTARPIHVAYWQYGYRLTEIADLLGVHAATVSRRLKQAEQRNV